MGFVLIWLEIIRATVYLVILEIFVKQTLMNAVKGHKNVYDIQYIEVVIISVSPWNCNYIFISRKPSNNMRKCRIEYSMEDSSMRNVLLTIFELSTLIGWYAFNIFFKWWASRDQIYQDWSKRSLYENILFLTSRKKIPYKNKKQISNLTTHTLRL